MRLLSTRQARSPVEELERSILIDPSYAPLNATTFSGRFDLQNNLGSILWFPGFSETSDTHIFGDWQGFGEFHDAKNKR